MQMPRPCSKRGKKKARTFLRRRGNLAGGNYCVADDTDLFSARDSSTEIMRTMEQRIVGLIGFSPLFACLIKKIMSSGISRTISCLLRLNEMMAIIMTTTVDISERGTQMRGGRRIGRKI